MGGNNYLSAYLGKHNTAGSGTVNDQLRVRILTSAAGIYTVLNKFVIYMSTNGATVDCTIRARLESNRLNDTETWVTFADQVPVSGWSGYNIINTSGITTYGNTASSQYGEIQFIFKCTAVRSNYANAYIQNIFGYGGVGWTTPTTLAKTGHVYSYDANQNVTFPGKITGNGSGLTSLNASNINAGTLSASYGGTGKNNLKDSANALINALETGSSTPVDGDYYISQYVGGGTTTTTYHRRPMSALWAYIKSKLTTTTVGSATAGTAIPADDITAWTTNTPTAINTAKFSGGSFTRGTFTQGTLPSLTYTAKSIPNVTQAGTASVSGDTLILKDTTLGTAIAADDITGWDAGTLPTHANDSFTAASLQSGFYTAGTAASLSYTAKSIPNISVSSVTVVYK